MEPTAEGETLTARALWLTAPRYAALRDEAVPSPAVGEVRIRALASGISQGTELLVYRGQVPADLPLDLPTLAGSFAFPIKYGYASVGRVLDVGAGVTALAPGDLVFTHHPHQSAYVVPEALPMRLPPSLERDPALGVFFANIETALNVVLDTPLRLGESAVVFGAGTVGLLIAQLLRRAGAGQITVVDPLASRRERAMLVGADAALASAVALLPSSQPDEAARPASPLAVTGEDSSPPRSPRPSVASAFFVTPAASAGSPSPRRERGPGGEDPPDVAIEASGAPDALQAAIDVVADEGTVVAVSWYGTKPVTLALGGHFHRGQVRLRSSQVGRLDPALAPRWDVARRTKVAAGLLPALRLEPLISHRIPFARAAEAYALLDEHPEEAGQVVLTYDDEGREE